MSNCWHDNEVTKLTFGEVYQTTDDFINTVGYVESDGTYYEGSSKLDPVLTEDETYQLYYLLCSSYWTSTIKYKSEKLRDGTLAMLIRTYGPEWSTEKKIQKKLRDMSDADIREGQSIIANAASNPSIEPSTQTLEELTYIDSQNVSKTKRSVLSAYSDYREIVTSDKDKWLIDKFKIMFISFPRIDEDGNYE